MSRGSLAVWGRKGERHLRRAQTLLLRQGQLLMLALQACCLQRAFVLQVHVAQRGELIGGRPRHQVHEERGGTTATEQLFCCGTWSSPEPMLWWHAASRRGHHMMECPGKSSSEEKPWGRPASPLGDKVAKASSPSADTKLAPS